SAQPPPTSGHEPLLFSPRTRRGTGTRARGGAGEVAERGLWGSALIPAFAPSCPETAPGSPWPRRLAERLKGNRENPERLQNLLVSARLGRHRGLPRKA